MAGWALAFFLGCCALAASDQPVRSYSNGFSIVLKTSEGLFQSLPASSAQNIAPRPVSIQPLDLPSIEPVAITDEGKVTREVSLSMGLIDLMNHVAHAKAIDHKQPGFFASYLTNFARAGCDASCAADIVDERYWTEDILNDQQSYFNQMASILIAINLSHHYLGHSDKYAEKTMGPDTKTHPINDFLSPAEWQASVKAGTINSLDYGMATEGARALFEAIDQMPKRPAWVAYLAPATVDLKDLNKSFARYEDDFFHGRIKR